MHHSHISLIFENILVLKFSLGDSSDPLTVQSGVFLTELEPRGCLCCESNLFGITPLVWCLFKLVLASRFDSNSWVYGSYCLESCSVCLHVSVHPSLTKYNLFKWCRMLLIWFLLCCWRSSSLLFPQHAPLTHYRLMKFIWWYCWH